MNCMATHLALLRKRRRLIAKKRSMRPYKLPDELVAGDRPLYGHQMTLERMEFLVPADTISEFGGVIKLVRESELIFSIFPSLNGIFYQLLKAESKHYLLRYDRSFPLTPYVVFEILEPHILANIIDQCKTKEALAGFRIAPCAEYAWMLEAAHSDRAGIFHATATKVARQFPDGMWIPGGILNHDPVLYLGREMRPP